MASLPKVTLHFLVELVKYQAKQKLGDNALNVLAKSLADYAGDGAIEKLTDFLDQGQNTKLITTAFQKADKCFSDLNPEYRDMIASKPLAKLDRLETVAKHFASDLNSEALLIGM